MGWKQRLIRRLAQAQMAGPHLSDALQVCRRLSGYGWSSSLGFWQAPGESPDSVASNYHTALQAIMAENLKSVLSIKVPALAYDYEQVRELLACAYAFGVPVHWDAQSPESAQPSWTLLERVVSRYPDTGCTLPSRWRRSLDDAKRVIELGVPVRLVKGQWRDPSDPARDARAGFLELIDILAGQGVHVSVATHDPALARAALTRLQAANTPCRLEQLLGLPIYEERVAQPLGVPVRVYVPYGHASLPYNLFYMMRRPDMAAWILKTILRGTPGLPYRAEKTAAEIRPSEIHEVRT